MSDMYNMDKEPTRGEKIEYLIKKLLKEIKSYKKLTSSITMPAHNREQFEFVYGELCKLEKYLKTEKPFAEKTYPGNNYLLSDEKLDTWLLDPDGPLMRYIIKFQKYFNDNGADGAKDAIGDTGYLTTGLFRGRSGRRRKYPRY